MRIIRSFLPTLVIASMMLFVVELAIAAPASQRSFFSGSAGTLPSDPKDRAGTYFRMAQVRALIEEMETRPCPKRK